jgi:hypothetical protein
MLERLTINDNGTSVLGTTDGDRGSDWGVLDLMWIDAWTATRRILQLPLQEYRAPVAGMASPYPSTFCAYSHVDLSSLKPTYRKSCEC